MVDIVRVDHFRGFAASWEVPGGDETAERGEWVNVPGMDLFQTLKQTLGDLPFWAEDLGVITPDVEELRDSFGFPGMRILQFALAAMPRISICRITTFETRSPLPARTTTTRRSAGLIPKPAKVRDATRSKSKKSVGFVSII